MCTRENSVCDDSSVYKGRDSHGTECVTSYYLDAVESAESRRFSLPYCTGPLVVGVYSQ
jgi:hypothetical protein